MRLTKGKYFKDRFGRIFKIIDFHPDYTKQTRRKYVYLKCITTDDKSIHKVGNKYLEIRETIKWIWRPLEELTEEEALLEVL